MAAHINVLKKYKQDILTNGLTENILLNKLISLEIIDKHLYHDIWRQRQNRISYFFDVLIKDPRRCMRFVEKLNEMICSQQIVETVRGEIREIQKVTQFGEFPYFPENYVIRNSVASELHEKILNLKAPNTLVVHGLPGYGKSSLVNQVLQDTCFIKDSNDVMIWINLGEHENLSNLLNTLKELYSLTQSQLNLTTQNFTELNDVRNALKKTFSDTKLSSAYLILDDVKSREVLNVFNFWCRKIVIAQEKVDSDISTEYIQINHGFKFEESVQLFKVALETTNLTKHLEYIKKIHELCDGCPMSINLIGSILKPSREFVLANQAVDIWESIINDLQRDQTYQAKLFTLIHRNVTSLSQSSLKYFHSLTIFPKHAYVNHELLMMLWGCNRQKVGQIMTEFERKSFVSSVKKTSYIYTIHSLIHSYLYYPEYQQNVEEYHKQIISGIDNVINSNLNDQSSCYILAYFGYHAKNAKWGSMFAYYFDLKILERKIRCVGSADVIADFEQYRDDILKVDGADLDKLNDYMVIIKDYSSYLHIMPETDIVRFILSREARYSSAAVAEAKKIAMNNFQFYFKIQDYSQSYNSCPRITTDSDIIAVAFINPDEIILGTRSGAIEKRVFNHYYKKVQKFVGHLDKVFKLIISPDKSLLFSLSDDKTAKLWQLPKNYDHQSPRCKQNYVEGKDDYSLFLHSISGQIISADFSQNSDEIVYGTSRGFICMVDIKRKQNLKNFNVGFPITCIKITKFQHEDVIICCFDKKINLYSKSDFTYYKLYVNTHCDSPYNFVLQHNSLYAITDTNLEMWPCRKILNDEKFSGAVLCAELSQKHILIGTEDFIYFYTSGNFLKLKTEYGVPLAVHILNEDEAISIEVQNKLLYRRKIALNSNNTPKITNLKTLSCVWKEANPIYSVANDVKLYIFDGSRILCAEELPSRIKLATFSSCGENLIYVTQQGRINYYNYTSRHTNEFKINTKDVSLIKCYNPETFSNVDFMSDIFGIASDNKIIIYSEHRQIDINFDYNSGKICDIWLTDDYLIAIDDNCNIIITNLSSRKSWSWSEQGLKFFKMDLSHSNNLAAFIARNDCDLAYWMTLLKYELSENVLVEERSKIKLDALPKVLRFSQDGKLLAVGCDNGNIEVYDVDRLTLFGAKRLVLTFHGNPVEDLVLSKINNKSVMVSVADQIAYWELPDFKEINKDLSSNEIAQIDDILVEDVDIKLYLKANEPLHKQLKYISASKDFKSFLVVDIDGNIYNVNLIATSDYQSEL